MATKRKPKGVYNRNTPDWFSDEVGVAAAYVYAGGLGFTQFTTISLFNNDTAGRSLQVYFISAFWDGAAVILVDQVKGTFGAKVSDATPLSPALNAPPGQCWVQRTPGAAGAPNPDISTPIGAIGLGFASGGVGYGAPMFVVPQGNSLRFSNDMIAAEAGITFWYTYLTGSV